MDTVLWVAQGLLALLFLFAGSLKLLQPYDRLTERMGWASDFSPNTVRAIGAVEILGAVGLILPMLTGILPWLTPLAAAGLVLTMIGAMRAHLRRSEPVVINLVLLAVALFVAVGRVTLVPVA